MKPEYPELIEENYDENGGNVYYLGSAVAFVHPDGSAIIDQGSGALQIELTAAEVTALATALGFVPGADVKRIIDTGMKLVDELPAEPRHKLDCAASDFVTACDGVKVVE